MMRLLRSWRDSLLLLAPQNFKLFALVTLKSTFETYKVLKRSWFVWLPIVALIVVRIFSINLGKPDWWYTLLEVISLMMAAYLTVAICLATRPSIGQKNTQYFAQRWRFIFVFIALALLFWQISFWWQWLIVHGYLSAKTIFFHPLAMHYYWMALFGAIPFASVPTDLQLLTTKIPGDMLLLNSCMSYVLIFADVIPLSIFFILFFLDSDGRVQELWRSLVRATKMVVYNLPLVAIICALMSVLVYRMVPGDLIFLVFIFLLKPLIINIWTNIYIKKFHEMPDLYFKQPK